MDLAFIVINIFATFVFQTQSMKEKWEIAFNFSTFCHSSCFKFIALLLPSKMNGFLSSSSS